MAKRFTDNQKWQDEWFFNLNQNGKLAWIYILDNCDHAGLWKKNITLLNLMTGCSYVEDDLLKLFLGRIIQVEDKWFIPKFVLFQYGDKFYSSKQKVVLSVIEILEKYQLIDYDTKGTPTLNKGLGKGYVRVMDKEKEKETDKETDMDKETDTEKEKDKVKYTFEFKTKEQRDRMTQDELEQYNIQLDIYSQLINK